VSSAPSLRELELGAPPAAWAAAGFAVDGDGPALGPARDAVQPGRRIATVRDAACLGVPVALMTPHPRAAS